MEHTPARTSTKALTAVELTLVLVMLATLAAIVMPQVSSASPDPRAQVLQSQLATLRDRIDLYRGRNPERRYPDLASQGWTPLISAGLLAEEPVNPLTGSSTVAAAPAPGAGWHFDRDTGRLGACYFSEPAGTPTPARP